MATYRQEQKMKRLNEQCAITYKAFDENTDRSKALKLKRAHDRAARLANEYASKIY